MKAAGEDATTAPVLHKEALQILLGVFSFAVGVNMVVPILPYYALEFGLSATQTTLVYSAYGFTLLPTLLLFGSASDSHGRKPVIYAASVFFVAGSLILLFSTSFTALIVGRCIQGVANGLAWGSIAAALQDVVPVPRREQGSLAFSFTYTAAVAVGSLAGGLLVGLTQVVWLPWLMHLVLLAAFFPLLLRLRETHEPASPVLRRASITPPQFRLPGFPAFVAPLTFGLTALGGLTIALAPVMAEVVSDMDAALLSGLLVFTYVAMASFSQLVLRQQTAYGSSRIGLVVLTVGGVSVAFALEAGSTFGLFAAMVLMGIGNGFAFKGTFALAELLSSSRNRAGVLAAYNVIMYVGLSGAPPVAGFFIDRVGLLYGYAGPASFFVGVAACAWAFGRGSVPDVLR